MGYIICSNRTYCRNYCWFLIARKVMTKELKKNPPINEEMIKTLMKGMGRTPNQNKLIN